MKKAMKSFTNLLKSLGIFNIKRSIDLEDLYVYIVSFPCHSVEFCTFSKKRCYQFLQNTKPFFSDEE